MKIPARWIADWNVRRSRMSDAIAMNATSALWPSIDTLTTCVPRAFASLTASIVADGSKSIAA